MSPAAGARPSTLLVSMPFCPVSSPSLQLGLLSAIGRAHGFAVETLHLNLDFAVQLGRAFYEALIESTSPAIGDWLFAKAAFREEAPDRDGHLPDDFANAVAFLRKFDVDADELRRLRDEAVPKFLDGVETKIAWSRYDIVGFSCTFQQNVASFALARRLKERFPNLMTLFGGSNFEVEMGEELVRTCPWIDYAVDGEADEIFPAFLAAVADGRSPLEVPGVISQAARAPRTTKKFTQIEHLPTPEYEEFYRRAESVGVIGPGPRLEARLPFESSRGCWWGQKHHCTFCGLNGTGMTFRQKSSGRLLEELAELTRRHGVFRFYAADNIMPPNFFKEFIPALASEERNYDLFFELKSNMTRAQIKALRDAGVRSIQPGIESLSSHVLNLMEKGVRAIQNVNVLRWARHYDIEVVWNLLWGFPEEREVDYEEQARIFPHLFHLQPPGTANRIWLERFSPLYFDRDRFPVERLEPERSLSYIYPDRISRAKVAYFFDHKFVDELPDTVFEPILATIAAWEEAWGRRQRPSLVYRWSPGLLHIEDRRNPEAPQLYSFESPLAEIYRATSDRPISAENIKQSLDLPWTADDIAEALELFATKGLVMREDNLFLALALPAQ